MEKLNETKINTYLKYCIKNNKIAELNDYTAIKSFIHIDD